MTEILRVPRETSALRHRLRQLNIRMLDLMHGPDWVSVEPTALEEAAARMPPLLAHRLRMQQLVCGEHRHAWSRVLALRTIRHHPTVLRARQVYFDDADDDPETDPPLLFIRDFTWREGWAREAWETHGSDHEPEADIGWFVCAQDRGWRWLDMAARIPVSVDIEDALAYGVERRGLRVNVGWGDDGTTHHWPLASDRAEANHAKNTAWESLWDDLEAHMTLGNLLPVSPFLNEEWPITPLRQ